MFDFFRIACVVPKVFVGDTNANTNEIINKMHEASQKGVDLAVFPELCTTGYTCGDLFFQSTLIKSAYKALARIVRESKLSKNTVVVGAPIEISGSLYNCGVVIADGKIQGIVPKTFIPNYGEFMEKRYFASCNMLKTDSISSKIFGLRNDYDIPIGNDLIFDLSGVKVGVEICEDLWAPQSPSNILSMSGAEVIVNLSASNETVSKSGYRKNLVSMQSSRSVCAYAYVSAGADESTTDLVFSGSSIICENGNTIAQNDEAADSDYLIAADIDVEKIRSERTKNTTFTDCAHLYANTKVREICVNVKESVADGSLCNIEENPFIPTVESHIAPRCLKIIKMQARALEKRLSVTGAKAIVGVSGGLDSTLALLVSVLAMKNMNRPASDVIGITMPCFGTSGRTYKNSLNLMKTLGVTSVEIDIKKACLQHFEDIGQSPEKFDLTYENAQARERTQVLMDYAGKVGGMVIGTGDMSELALGWCTYNGDQMSMYGVNAGVPKTLIPLIIKNVCDAGYFPESTQFLEDICDTPISPELLPPDEAGKISQQTEDIVGPYALHDFFLYYVVRFGFSPKKIYHIAKIAFGKKYKDEVILKWLKNFYKRFFSQQFKRSCMPDGVKIGSVGLSPRGDFRMPSDATASLWVREVDEL